MPSSGGYRPGQERHACRRRKRHHAPRFRLAGQGRKVFKKCKSCHTVNKGGKNGVGPNLWNVVGKAKASVDGFRTPAFCKLGEWSGNLDSSRRPRTAKGPNAFRSLKKAGDRPR